MGIYTDHSQASSSFQKIPTKLNELISSIMNKASEILNMPTTEQIQKIDWSNIATILGTISLLLILAIIFLITLYILKSIGLYVMAKKEGKDFAWLSFVPFGCLFSFGFITGKTKIFGIEVDHPEFLLPVLFASSYMPYVGPIASVFFIFVYFAMLYRVYQTRIPNFATVLLILSIIVPLVSPLILFVIRNSRVP